MSKGKCLYCKQVFEKKSDAHMFCCRLCGERHRKGVDTKCGNAVSPVISCAMVRANLPEWCSTTIVTMAQLHKTVAV